MAAYCGFPSVSPYPRQADPGENFHQLMTFQGFPFLEYGFNNEVFNQTPVFKMIHGWFERLIQKQGAALSFLVKFRRREDAAPPGAPFWGFDVQYYIGVPREHSNTVEGLISRCHPSIAQTIAKVVANYRQPR